MPPRLRTSSFFRTLLVWSCLYASIAFADDTVQRTPVQSTSIASVGYDEREHVLEIEFRNGGIYHYSGVTKEFFSQFMSANSKGRFFVLKIRGKFPFARVKENAIAGQ